MEKFVQDYKPKIRNPQKDTVAIQIDIDTSGVISNPTIVKSANPILDQAAMDFVRTLPKMVPANNNGVIVKSRTVMPVIFKNRE